VGGGRREIRTLTPAEGNSVLRTGAANLIRLAPKRWSARGESNSRISRFAAGRLTVLATRAYGGARRNRTPILSERWFSGPVADHSARALRMSKILVPGEGVEPSRPKTLVSRTSAASNYATPAYGGEDGTRTHMSEDAGLANR
jgi:hypothetical protein